eukprot:TRINITY_DN15295_c0_g1::TRINITY_DN15295_c0_g1_i1::g.30775::m.30775 TRINITY_DN15295_c0_g1::TRINITY_DN15295_c0_g1_i1::g.30775  ORF type:complete len:312 (-),score=79.67,Cg6151-P/PF10233.4/1.1e-08,DUF998/PF06197.8/0.4,DUF998/PF06197.8/57,COPI_assoc/PF08507.5/0.48,DUF3784/PF12650.2/0.59,DUF3784/PF12650.2/79 TRINITY_DN15295_c0_g1_i1:56-952(-)
MSEGQPFINNQPVFSQPVPSYTTNQQYPQQQVAAQQKQDQGGCGDLCSGCMDGIRGEYNKGNTKKYARFLGLGTIVMLVISAVLCIFSFDETTVVALYEIVIACILTLMEMPFICKCHDSCVEWGEALSKKPLATKGALYLFLGALGFVLYAVLDHTTFIGFSLAFVLITGVLYCIASTKPGDTLPQYMPVPAETNKPVMGATYATYPQPQAQPQMVASAPAVNFAPSTLSSSYQNAYQPQAQPQVQQPAGANGMVYDVVKNNPELAARAAQAAFNAAANNPQMVQAAYQNVQPKASL